MIDMTHVDAYAPKIRRFLALDIAMWPQNIIAACDFSMCFTFVMVGWEDNAHSSSIFKFARDIIRTNFLFTTRLVCL